MAEPENAVFLSYASQDTEAARHLCDGLRASGIEVWFDQSELRGGDLWDRQIRQQIHDCALFVAVISVNTQARLEGYFRLEWRLAVERTRLMADAKPFLLPVVIDATSDKDAEVPDSFRAVQWTRLPGGQSSSTFVERVARLLSPESAPAPAKPRASVAGLPGAPTASTRWVPLVIAGLVAIAIGYFAIERFMAKRPATAVSSPAARVTGASGQSAILDKSIAVLPFADMSEQKDQEYFADGMAEEILNLLVKIPELKVIARTSSFQFKGKSTDLRTIGAMLGAAYVVEGSVRRSGEHFRVTAQLIDTRDGAHHWSETYDRDIGDVIKVQGEVATSLVRALQLEVATPVGLLSQPSPRSNEAYDIYLRGLHAKEQFNQRGEEEALADFRRALELDSTFVAAAESLAVTLANIAFSGYVPPRTAWEQARAASQTILGLNPKSALAHGLLGIVHVRYDWDWPGADREFTIARGLSPNRPFVLNYAAKLRMALGDWNGAADLVSAASTLDPLDPGFEFGRGLLYLRMGRTADAERAFRRMLDISPTFEEGHFYLGTTLLLDGKADAALLEMRKETRPAWQMAGLALAYHASQRTAEAAAALARFEAEHANDLAMQIAEVHAFRNEKSQAFTWLERAFAQKDVNLWSIKGDPLLKDLEGDPRYGAFLRKMNLPQ